MHDPHIFVLMLLCIDFYWSFMNFMILCQCPTNKSTWSNTHTLSHTHTNQYHYNALLIKPITSASRITFSYTWKPSEAHMHVNHFTHTRNVRISSDRNVKLKNSKDWMKGLSSSAGGNITCMLNKYIYAYDKHRTGGNLRKSSWPECMKMEKAHCYMITKAVYIIGLSHINFM